MTEHKYPRYDPYKPCPKCRYAGISTKHQIGMYTQEHFMRRECSRCGYVWNERPLDEE